MGTLVRLNLRLSRLSNALWIVGVLSLLVIGPPAFVNFLPTTQEREALVQQMNMGAAITVMYGPVQEPGTLGQLLMWEIAAFVMVMGAIWMIVYATRVGRVEEESGGSEFVAALGYSGPRRTTAALITVALLSLLTGFITCAILFGFGQIYQELPIEGATAFGVFFCLQLFTVATLAILCGQIMPTAGGARSVSFAILGLAFVLRAIASINSDFEWLRWLSYLAWLDLVTPYTDNHLGLLIPIFAGTAAMAVGAVWVAGRRDFATGLFEHSERSHQLRKVSNLRALITISDRGLRRGWWAGIIAMALFVGSAITLVTSMIDEQEGIRDLMEGMLEDNRALEETFTEFFALLIVVLIFVYIAQIIVKAGTSEVKGLNELIVATGRPRNAELRQRIVCAGIQAAVTTIVAGLVYAASVYGTTESSDYAGSAFWSVVYHFPGIIALVGLTALIVGSVPRWRHLVWLVPIYTWVISYYGPLLQVPEWVEKTSILYWGEMSETHLIAWIVLSAIGLGGILIGLTIANRRNQVMS